MDSQRQNELKKKFSKDLSQKIVDFSDNVIPDNTLSINGTFFLEQTLVINYHDLVEIFGQPNGCGDNYKVTTQWILRTPAGVATIYDWKQTVKYDPSYGYNTKYDLCEWNIGGTDKSVIKYVIEKVFNDETYTKQNLPLKSQ